ncbi:hypothetical protein PG993_009484 [Apiospora rasikravindrae]|uniref:Uncharacterized protein n=1 Tax=Apiospora rasikravindrae TaxID=990691 RepID=A0ABR1SLA5_9PEZI
MKILQTFILSYLCGYAAAAAVTTARTAIVAPDDGKVCDQCTKCLTSAAAKEDVGAVVVCWDTLCETCAKGERAVEHGIDSQSWLAEDDDKVCDDCVKCLDEADDNGDAEDVCWDKWCNTCKENHKDDDDYGDEE